MTEKITWHIEKRKLKDLQAYYKNPRRLTDRQFEHLKTSLDKFGLIDRPFINANGTIIGGHQRINVMIKEGEEEIEVMVPNRLLDNAEVEELNIRHNKNTGEWDFDILANEWDQDDLLSWGFEASEFAIDEINVIDTPEQADDATMSPPSDPVSKLGDIYELNEHRIICGDSTDPDIVMAVLNGNEPILMVTDPPYGVNYDPAWRKDIKGKHGVAARALGQVQNDDQVNWALAWSLFPGNVAYVWHASLHTHEVYKSLVDSEYQMISNIIWTKQHFALSRGDYHWQHEPCWYAVRKGQSHNWQGSRKESTLWEVANMNAFGTNQEDERTAHSTQKPLECMARPIRNNSAEGEGVYDPFLGSGTTLIAAESLKRTCYGIELDPAYVDIIVARWTKYMKNKNLPYIIKKNGEEINGEEMEAHG
jgi:DNA modification methylase